MGFCTNAQRPWVGMQLCSLPGYLPHSAASLLLRDMATSPEVRTPKRRICSARTIPAALHTCVWAIVSTGCSEGWQTRQ